MKIYIFEICCKICVKNVISHYIVCVYIRLKILKTLDGCQIKKKNCTNFGGGAAATRTKRDAMIPKARAKSDKR